MPGAIAPERVAVSSPRPIVSALLSLVQGKMFPSPRSRGADLYSLGGVRIALFRADDGARRRANGRAGGRARALVAVEVEAWGAPGGKSALLHLASRVFRQAERTRQWSMSTACRLSHKVEQKKHKSKVHAL